MLRNPKSFFTNSIMNFVSFLRFFKIFTTISSVHITFVSLVVRPILRCEYCVGNSSGGVDTFLLQPAGCLLSSEAYLLTCRSREAQPVATLLPV